MEEAKGEITQQGWWMGPARGRNNRIGHNVIEMEMEFEIHEISGLPGTKRQIQAGKQEHQAPVSVPASTTLQRWLASDLPGAPPAGKFTGCVS